MMYFFSRSTINGRKRPALKSRLDYRSVWPLITKPKGRNNRCNELGILKTAKQFDLSCSIKVYPLFLLVNLCSSDTLVHENCAFYNALADQLQSLFLELFCFDPTFSGFACGGARLRLAISGLKMASFLRVFYMVALLRAIYTQLNTLRP